MRGHRTAAAFALAGLLGCGQKASLRSGQGVLEAPSGLDFGQLFVGATRQRTVALGNSGTALLSLQATLSGDAQLSLQSSSVVVPEGGSATLAVTLKASQPGTVTATLSLQGDARAVIPVTADVVPDLSCPQDDPCNSKRFDPNQGACVGTPLADGTGCDAGDPCQQETVCAGGACKGSPVSCDDHDVCTTDYCQPGVGCQHLDHSADCQGTNPCEIYDCDPAQGCQSTPASDGTPCAAEVQCVQANVCLGGACTGAPMPDGIPCVDPKDPCAHDARCSGGGCHSPTADALVPGDVLWMDVALAFRDGDGGELPLPDAGPDGGPIFVPGWRAAAATDSLGNLYLDDDSPDGGGDLVSLDVCGKERWRVPVASSAQWTNGRHLLAQGVLLTVTAAQTLLAQSEQTGQTLWIFDPRQGATTPQDFTIEDVALSNAGVLYYTADYTEATADGGSALGREVGGLLRNGTVKLQAALPALTQGPNGPWRFGYPLLVDENESLYTAMHVGDGQAEIDSFDQTGAPRWSLPVARDWLDSFSENQGIFVEPASLTAFDSRGSVVWSHVEPASAVQPSGHSPVVAPDGSLTLPRFRMDSQTTGHGVVESYSPTGSELWSWPMASGEFPESSHLLDAQGLVYLVTSAFRLVALDAASGAVAWQIRLPTEGPIYNGVLALTPAGSLVASARRELFGVYAGSPLASSPWPRFRGGNDNRSCPSPTPGPPSP